AEYDGDVSLIGAYAAAADAPHACRIGLGLSEAGGEQGKGEQGHGQSADCRGTTVSRSVAVRPAPRGGQGHQVHSWRGCRVSVGGGIWDVNVLPKPSPLM